MFLENTLDPMRPLAVKSSDKCWTKFVKGLVVYLFPPCLVTHCSLFWQLPAITVCSTGPEWELLDPSKPCSTQRCQTRTALARVEDDLKKASWSRWSKCPYTRPWLSRMMRASPKPWASFSASCGFITTWHLGIKSPLMCNEEKPSSLPTF